MLTPSPEFTLGLVGIKKVQSALLNNLGAQPAKEKDLKGFTVCVAMTQHPLFHRCIHLPFSEGLHKKHTPTPGQDRVAAVQGKGEGGLLLLLWLFAAGLWALSSLWFADVKEQVGPDPSCDLPSFLVVIVVCGE